MKQILLLLVLILAISCKNKVSVLEMQKAIKEDIQNQYGVLVDSVCLIKKEAYEYVGYAAIYVGQNYNVEVEVLLDKENPMNYIYKIPYPQALLLEPPVEDMFNEEAEKLQNEIDSLFGTSD